MLLLPISAAFLAMASNLCTRWYACGNMLLIILSPSAQFVTQHAFVPQLDVGIR